MREILGIIIMQLHSTLHCKKMKQIIGYNQGCDNVKCTGVNLSFRKKFRIKSVLRKSAHTVLKPFNSNESIFTI